jgi:hypothetical protein
LSAVFIAKYPGRCDDCREIIQPGQRVEYKRGDLSAPSGVLVHEVCDDVAPELSDLDRDAQKPVCEECWLIQPCGCEDG